MTMIYFKECSLNQWCSVFKVRYYLMQAMKRRAVLPVKDFTQQNLFLSIIYLIGIRLYLLTFREMYSKD